MNKYKYILQEEKKRFFDFLKDVNVCYNFVTVENGWVTIKKGYSWDGATPKIKVFGKWIGVSDGKNNELKKPTMWHDVFTQYGIGKKSDVDEIFRFDMFKIGWKYYKIYYKAVRMFGWLRWNRYEK